MLIDPMLQRLRAAVPFRSVISAPVACPAGQCVGVVSVHFSQGSNTYCRALGELITTSTPADRLRDIASKWALQ
jgi:hypothetical protein